MLVSDLIAALGRCPPDATVEIACSAHPDPLPFGVARWAEWPDRVYLDETADAGDVRAGDGWGPEATAGFHCASLSCYCRAGDHDTCRRQVSGPCDCQCHLDGPDDVTEGDPL